MSEVKISFRTERAREKNQEFLKPPIPNQTIRKRVPQSNSAKAAVLISNCRRIRLRGIQ